MSLFSFCACTINRHEPLRRNVQWNGRAYIGTCRHCGAQIMRRAHRDWRRHKEDESKDFVAAN